jgi:hypothetical protein
MASSGKPKTTMAKLKREATLRERRLDKAVRKQIRKQAQLEPDPPVELDPDAPEIDPDLEAPEIGADLSAPESAPGVGL